MGCEASNGEKGEKVGENAEVVGVDNGGRSEGRGGGIGHDIVLRVISVALEIESSLLTADRLAFTQHAQSAMHTEHREKHTKTNTRLTMMTATIPPLIDEE